MTCRLIAFDKCKNRLEAAKSLGADEVFDASDSKALAEAVAGMEQQFDLIVDASGDSGTYIENYLKLLKPGGRYQIYGHAFDKISVDPRLVSAFGWKIIGVDATLEETKRMMALAERLVSSGLVNAKAVISHHIALEEAEEWVLKCGEKPCEMLKVVIDIA